MSGVFKSTVFSLGGSLDPVERRKNAIRSAPDKIWATENPANEIDAIISNTKLMTDVKEFYEYVGENTTSDVLLNQWLQTILKDNPFARLVVVLLGTDLLTIITTYLFPSCDVVNVLEDVVGKATTRMSVETTDAAAVTERTTLRKREREQVLRDIVTDDLAPILNSNTFCVIGSPSSAIRFYQTGSVATKFAKRLLQRRPTEK